MKRAAIKRQLVPRRAREPDEFATFMPRARVAALEQAIGHQLTGALGAAPKIPKAARKRQDIRDSAKGEACLIRLPGCDGGGETTVWCHLPEAFAGRGMSLKGIDLLGAFGCRNCHDIVDRRAPRPAMLSEQDVSLMFYRALARSVVRLAQKGLL